jgi:PKD repeat protein
VINLASFYFTGPKRKFKVVMKIARRLLLLGLIIFAIVNCDQVDFTAPAGATLSISVQPPTVANNGIANVTVVGTRANGAPLPDETVIQFTTNLGSISPNPVKTDNGIASATFRAGVRSGTATITATSGAAEAVTVDVIVGEARPQQVILVADPSTLPVGGGTIELRAHVTDADGNPLAGIGVFFQTDAGTLESGGRTVRTNDAGIAIDHLTTNVETNVTATTSNGQTDDFNIRISPGEGSECDFTFSPTDPVVDQDIFFVDTSVSNEGPAIVQSLWDFGDGETAEGFSVTHSYSAVGTFTVVHTIVDAEGFTTVCEPVEITVTRGEPDCQFLFSPPDPVDGDLITFDASESDDPNGEIVSYTWNFGDGSPIVTESDPRISHSYPACGPDDVELSFTVVLTVTDNDGQESTCTEDLVIDCEG